VDNISGDPPSRGTICLMTVEWPLDDPRRGPIHLRRELLARGMSDREIARSVADGSLHRLRHGAYVVGSTWSACDVVGRHALSVRAVYRQARTAIVVSHVSGVGEWGIAQWDLPLSQVHITRDDQRAGRHEAGVHQHLGALRENDIVLRNGIRVTAVPRTCLDTVSLVDVEHGLVIVNDALHKRLTTPDELAECAAFMEQWPGSLRHRVVLRLADGRIESVGETRFLYLCWDQGLPLPIPQYKIYDNVGRLVAVVDFAWPELGLFVEFDGKIKYKAPDRDGETVVDVVLREKQREELVSRLTGWRCLRVVWSDLHHPERTAATVKSLFRPTSVAN
jgi:hypothetical protein